MGVKDCVDNVVKSEEDQRKYRALVLDNNLKVLLISDSTTDKSAAAIDVHIGKSLMLACFLFVSLRTKLIPSNSMLVLGKAHLDHSLKSSLVT